MSEAVVTKSLAAAGMTDYDSELKSNMWKGQRDGNPDVEAELASADEEGEKVG
jgi:hypothetical protein